MTQNTYSALALLLLLPGAAACGGGSGGSSPDAGDVKDTGSSPKDDGGSDLDAGEGDASDVDASGDMDGDVADAGDEPNDADTDASEEAGTDDGGANDGGGSGDTGTADADVVDAGPASATFTITPDMGRHAISSYIYGVDTVDAASAVPATVVHMGNDEASGYNWEINATNVQSAAEQLNVPLGSGSAGARPAEVLSAAQANGGAALLTVPIGGYVAADSNGDDVLQTTDYLTTRFKQNHAAKGAAFTTTPDTADDSVYQDEFVNWTMTQAGSTKVVFALDNEPSIWDTVHPAFHPTKATYDDVVGLGVEYAKAIKDAWASAEVGGPVAYGWLSYTSLQESPDATSKGPFLDYYLEQMAAAEVSDGRRLLDYLNVHWYSEVEANGTRVIADSADPAVVDARVQAPRSLWDASYLEPSWILSTMTEGINLVPRLKSKITQKYPDTKLAISAWSYGGGSHISGAVAAADALGIFGREGVDMAIVDLLGLPSPYVLAAFRAFLDYDGAGAHFGDTSVKAETSDVAASSVYASVQAAADTELVIVAINKLNRPLNATLNIGGLTQYSTCAVFELTSASATFTAGAALSASAANQFEYAMPAMSVAVIVPAP